MELHLNMYRKLCMIKHGERVTFKHVQRETSKHVKRVTFKHVQIEL